MVVLKKKKSWEEAFKKVTTPWPNAKFKAVPNKIMTSYEATNKLHFQPVMEFEIYFSLAYTHFTHFNEKQILIS